MLFLFLTSIAVSETFIKEIKQNAKALERISSSEYENADIKISAGEALMLVEWEDAIIDINIPSIDSKVTLSKDAGLSMFTFKNDAEIHIEFTSDVSFFYFPIKDVSYIYHISNIQSHTSLINWEDIQKGVYFDPIGKYDMSLNFPSVGDCTVQSCYGNRCSFPFGDQRYTNRGASSLITKLDGQHNKCEPGLHVSIMHKETLNPTVPTVFHMDTARLIGFTDSMAFGGVGDAFELDRIQSLKSYEYLFLSNNLTKPENYKVVVYTSKEKKELKQGEIFRKCFKLTYGMASIEFSSKNCAPVNNSMMGGEPIEIIERNQIKISPITDKYIPGNCHVNDNKMSPAIIAAIVIAVVVVIAAIIIVVIVVLKKKKSKEDSAQQATENAETV